MDADLTVKELFRLVDICNPPLRLIYVDKQWVLLDKYTDAAVGSGTTLDALGEALLPLVTPTAGEALGALAVLRDRFKNTAAEPQALETLRRFIAAHKEG